MVCGSPEGAPGQQALADTLETSLGYIQILQFKDSSGTGPHTSFRNLTFRGELLPLFCILNLA